MECELHDVGHRCFLRVPSDDQVWTIGLSVTEELTGCVANLVYSSELVVIFFSIQHRSDGHWVTPHPDLPLILNGEALPVSTLLSHGSVLMVGDHTLTYTIKIVQQSQPESNSLSSTGVLSAPTSPQPPPKPARQGNTQIKSTALPYLNSKPGRVFESSSDTTVEQDENCKKLTFIKAHPDSTKDESDLERSMEVFMSLKDSLVNTDVELLNHIDSPEQMANVCSSYMFQFLLGKGLTMSAREMDSVHQSMQTLSMDQASTLFDFLRGMKNKDVICDNDQGPFLRLIGDVLLFTMDEEASSETCMKILVHVSIEPPIARHIAQRGLVPIVSACSAVYPHNVHIQTMVCRLYGNVLESHRNGVCPIKEAVVDLIIRSLGLHKEEKPFVRTALRCLCGMIRLHGVQGKTGVPIEVLRLSDSVLSHMEENLLSVIQGIHNRAGGDREISDMCVEIMEVLLNYRSDGSYSVIDYNEIRQRSDSLTINPMADSVTRECEKNPQYSETNDGVDRSLHTKPSSSDEAVEDGTSTASTLYATVHKPNLHTSMQVEDFVTEDSMLGPVQFEASLNSTTVKKQQDSDTHLYEDVMNETTDNLHSNDNEQPSVNMVDNDLYGDVNVESGTNEEEEGDTSTDYENSHTESENELKFEKSLEATQEKAREGCGVPDCLYSSKENIEKQTSQESGNSSPEPKLKKSAFIKKRLGGYLSKLKPKRKKKKQNLTGSLTFKDGNQSLDEYDFCDDDNIDTVSTTSTDVTSNEASVKFPVAMVSTDQNQEYNDHLIITSSEASNGQMRNHNVINSNLEPPPDLFTDSDSTESEFKLRPGVHELDHELSESEGEQEFHIDVEGDFGPSSEDTTDLQAENISRPLDLNVTLEVDDKCARGNEHSVHPSSSCSSFTSDDPNTTGEEDKIPDSRSEYSEEIAQSMESRIGSKVPWVSTLKRIYETPTSKFKKAVGVSKKVDVVQNPKYSGTTNDQKPPKVLLTQYKSRENLSTGDIYDGDENSETEGEFVDRGHEKTRKDVDIPNPKKKLTKFEALKQKNQREKQKKYPWSPKS